MSDQTQNDTPLLTEMLHECEIRRLGALLQLLLMADMDARSLTLSIRGMAAKHFGSETARDFVAVQFVADQAAERIARYTQALCLMLRDQPNEKEAQQIQPTDTETQVLH